LDARLECRKALTDPLLDRLRIGTTFVQADPIARRPAKELVDGHTQRFTRQVPQRLLHAAQGTGQDRAAPVKGVPVHRLPVVHDPARILADQVWRQLVDRLGTGQGPPFEDRLSQTNQAIVGVDLEKEPPRFDQECLQLDDLHGSSFRLAHGDRPRTT
jgi:hypothetical protein